MNETQSTIVQTNIRYKFLVNMDYNTSLNIVINKIRSRFTQQSTSTTDDRTLLIREYCVLCY